MASLRFEPTSDYLGEQLTLVWPVITEVVTQKLLELGVAQNDIVITRVENTTEVTSWESVQISMITDNLEVTAPEIAKVIDTKVNFLFEISRILVVGDDNWTSNY